jgi:diacylglycerol kinase (ATP)
MSYFNDRIKAFGFAFSGLFQAFKQEVHLKLHLVIAFLVIGLGFFFDITKADWIIILACITLVISFEMFNSVIEKLCDIVMPGQHPKIKYIKDVAAAAVLVASLFAFIVGLMVFLPYFF